MRAVPKQFNRGELVSHLSELLKDKEVQQSLPSGLKQQAINIISRETHRSGHAKENAVQHQSNKLPKRLNATPQKKYTTLQKNTNTSCSSGFFQTSSPISNQSTTPANRGKSRSPFRDLINTSSSHRMLTDESEKSRRSTNAYQREKEAIRAILQKQRDAESEKTFLQDKIGELKHLIAQQKRLLDRNSLASCRSVNSTDELTKSNKQMGAELDKHRRKNKDLFEEQTALRSQVDELQHQQYRVCQALEEQRQLIDMYRVVIGELKTEMKKESKQLGSVRNELQIANNLLEKTKQKYEILHDKTRAVVDSVDTHMRGFFQ